MGPARTDDGTGDPSRAAVRCRWVPVTAEEVQVEGITAVQARIAAIRSTVDALAARPPAVAAAPDVTRATASSAPGTVRPGAVGVPGGTPSFADVLAGEVARGPGAAPASATQGMAAPSAVPAVTGFSPEQVRNAIAVVRAGEARGLSVRDVTIGVMTAMGESSLRVLDHGDAVGPDSRGLFQQRDNGAWGTYADRMDPTRSATSFFTALERVAGRDGMAPTLVAHAVQRNADPQHYARYWDDAVRLVGAIGAVR